MYVVRNDTTNEILAIRLCEEEAFDVRDVRSDWEDFKVVWEATDADVLLSEIDRIGKACVKVKDSDSGQDFLFRHNEKNEIVQIVMLNGVVAIDVETIRPNYFNDAIVINGNIDIKTHGMEVF